MERKEERVEELRLDVAGFIHVYRWVNSYLSDEVGIVLDEFVYQGVMTEYPHDVVALYQALADSDDHHMRLMAATGLQGVAKLDLQEGLRLLEQLKKDEEPGIASQARETAERFTDT
jgi:hypothetical protein